MILKAFIEKNQKYKTLSGLEIDRLETYIVVSNTLNGVECYHDTHRHKVSLVISQGIEV